MIAPDRREMTLIILALVWFFGAMMTIW